MITEAVFDRSPSIMALDDGTSSADPQRSTSKEQHNINGGVYTVRSVPGRGLGCFANSKLVKGTRILDEAPLVTVPKQTTNLQSMEMSLLKQLKSLSRDQQYQFFSLHNAHKGRCSPVIGITKTNAIPFGSSGADGGVFIRAARINHSCHQNAQNVWNRNLNKLTIHAIRDIDEGEEITIAYVDNFEPFETRQDCLEEAFGFKCSCELCFPVEESKKRDARLQEILRLDSGLGDGKRIMSKPQDCLRDAHTILHLLCGEGVVGSRVARVYNDALQIVVAHSDQARAKVFAQRACAQRLMVEGDDSPETVRLQGISEDPTRSGLYGSSRSWETPPKAIPEGLSDAEFEDWLWRKGRF